jgi:hypothetical protein
MNKQKGSIFFTIILGIAIITVIIVMVMIAANGVKNKKSNTVNQNIEKSIE